MAINAQKEPFGLHHTSALQYVWSQNLLKSQLYEIVWMYMPACSQVGSQVKLANTHTNLYMFTMGGVFLMRPLFFNEASKSPPASLHR